MTRKDYVALAEALNTAYEQASTRPDWGWERTWEASVYAVADTLEQDNPRFDRERFVKACQGERL